jgi:copper chaperone
MDMEKITMEKTVLRVDGMSCEHCVKAITKAVSALPGVSDVIVDLDGKIVTVEYDTEKAPLDRIKFEIEEQGYDVA